MATGMYYRQNVLKFRIMREVFFADHPLTYREIADLLDMPAGTISETMGHYNKQKLQKHFGRLKRKVVKHIITSPQKSGVTISRENSY